MPSHGGVVPGLGGVERAPRLRGQLVGVPAAGPAHHLHAVDIAQVPHRVIQGFVIQGGDPWGNGMGEPGFTFPDETWPGARHDRAGLLCIANRGPNTNGMQFFITDAPTPHLDGATTAYTIFGECSPVSLVHALAS